MRIPARPNPLKQRTASTLSMPIPIGGINARDDIANMGPQFALSMVNVWPDYNQIRVRKGYTEHSTSMTNPVRSVMPWVNSSGSVKILAATSDTIYNATTAGTAATSLGTGFTNGDWQHINSTTPGGHFLLMANGADAIRQYDGSSITTPSYTGSGFTAANIINFEIHKSRLWMIEKDSTDVWYLGTNAIAGAASKFPLGGVFKSGGYVMAAGTYSMDAGDGMDDFLAFVSSQGEVLIYAGTDPASANTWQLEGRFKTARPLGRRCLARISGDLLILTEKGVISTQGMLQYGREQQELASASRNIDPVIIQAAELYGSNAGWELTTHDKSNMLILNVPVSADTSYKQYVMNILTGAWSEFNDINSCSWCSTQDALYFGGIAGTVSQAENGYSDNGSNINASFVTAWNYLDSRGVEKHLNMLRLTTTSQGTPGILLTVGADFNEATPSGSISVTASSAAVWDSATWDSAVWGGTTDVTNKWTAATAVGMCFSVAVRLLINGGECNIHAIDVSGTSGGTL